MNRKKVTTILFFLLLFLGLAALVYILYSHFYLGGFFSNFSKKVSINTPMEYPFVNVLDVRLGRLSNYHRNNNTTNNIIAPTHILKPLSDSLRDLFKFNYLEFDAITLSMGDYKNSQNKPFQFVAFHNTVIDSVKYSLFVLKYTNLDNSVVYLNFVTPQSRVMSDTTTNDYFEHIINESKYKFPSPVFEIASKDSCYLSFPMSETYCNWYFSSKNKENIDTLVRNWAETGIAPKKLEKYPLLFKLVPYSYE